MKVLDIFRPDPPDVDALKETQDIHGLIGALSYKISTFSGMPQRHSANAEMKESITFSKHSMQGTSTPVSG